MQPQMMMYTPPPSNHGNFDPSARFGKGASYNIPVSNANNKSILRCNTFLPFGKTNLASIIAKFIIL